MKRWIERSDLALKYLLVLLMLLMVADVTWQVVSRYVVKSPSSYTEEIARFLLIWISFLGASYAYRHRLHLGIDLLTEKLTGTSKHWANIFSYCMCALFFGAVLVFGGSNLVLLTLELEQVSGALGLPMFYVYSVIPLSGILMLLYSVEFVRQEFFLLTQNTKSSGGC